MFVNSAKTGQPFQDLIFRNNNEARQRASEAGPGVVVNGTIGALLDDEGRLVTFESIDRIHAGLDVRAQSGYAPMEGYPGFIAAAEHFCFGGFRPESEIRGVSVSGGLAGIHHAVVNFTEPGDEVITTDWFWGPYESILNETGRRIATVPMSTDGTFDTASFERRIRDAASRQGSVMILLNTPAHNPTGYTVENADFSAFIDMLNEIDAKIILFLDTAYMEFARPESKSVFRMTDRLKRHVLTIVDYSISKGFTRYGLRSAVLFGIHRERAALDEFFHSIVLSNRATYGSCASTGQLVLDALFRDKAALDVYYGERDRWRRELASRAEAFFSVIDPALAMPYREGFFTSVICGEAAALCDEMKRKDIFLVPLKKGIRVGLCSMAKGDCAKVAGELNIAAAAFADNG